MELLTTAEQSGPALRAALCERSMQHGLTVLGSVVAWGYVDIVWQLIDACECAPAPCRAGAQSVLPENGSRTGARPAAAPRRALYAVHGWHPLRWQQGDASCCTQRGIHGMHWEPRVRGCLPRLERLELAPLLERHAPRSCFHAPLFAVLVHRYEGVLAALLSEGLELTPAISVEHMLVVREGRCPCHARPRCMRYAGRGEAARLAACARVNGLSCVHAHVWCRNRAARPAAPAASDMYLGYCVWPAQLPDRRSGGCRAMVPILGPLRQVLVCTQPGL